MNAICVFAASRMEGRPVEKFMRRDVYSRLSNSVSMGQIGPDRVTLIVTGMGRGKASGAGHAWLSAHSSSSAVVPAASRLTASGAASPVGPRNAAAFVIGLAGSLDDSINEGDLVLYQSVVAREEPPVQCSARVNDRIAGRLRAAGIQCRLVRGISDAKIASTRAEKEDLSRNGAAVVDMESYDLVSIACQAGIPITVLRAVSDGMDKPMPNLNGALTEKGEFSPVALALACLRRPLATAGLYASSRKAMAALERAVGSIFSTPLDLETR
jgi:nucleoside phosphorylase